MNWKQRHFSCWAVSLLLLLILQVRFADAAPSVLDKAFEKGIVEWMYNPWQTRDAAPMLATIRQLDPGIVYRLGFLYGGPNHEFLERSKAMAGEIRRHSPQILIGATLPEVVSRVVMDNVDLSCEAGQAPVRFAFEQMISMTGAGAYHGYSWINPARPEAQAYYLCLGKKFVDAGFNIIEFQNAAGIIEHTPRAQRRDAIMGLLQVKKALRRYAGKRPLYFAGDAALSRWMDTAIVYNPARFFHTDAWGVKYQNRMPRVTPQGHPIGVGYSYALSQAMITETIASSRKGVTIVFNVDNFDQTQDDLRRLMELDAENRRFLIMESSRIARRNGVYFAPPIAHCEGCVDKGNVSTTEHCMLVADAQGNSRLDKSGRPLMAYNAHACGDHDAIRAAIRR
jgi:hypothetical protein